ncbi:hypothetical protein NUW54_g4320 [Trametes sanguinea]|uniref:Uncharacterized protein n=1 Tax=Trametes sanguinea TaxID=158606 RepID=A0ACC1PZU9_9APHY|nr:hypothetical protein NUW54_g4320 [Trametes sanguinea]
MTRLSTAKHQKILDLDQPVNGEPLSLSDIARHVHCDRSTVQASLAFSLSKTSENSYLPLIVAERSTQPMPNDSSLRMPVPEHSHSSLPLDGNGVGEEKARLTSLGTSFLVLREAEEKSLSGDASPLVGLDASTGSRAPWMPRCTITSLRSPSWHDNDPKHTAHLVQEWLEHQNLLVLPWPPSSPDLNIIENVWAEIKKHLETYRPRPCNTEELWRVVQKLWCPAILANIHAKSEWPAMRTQHMQSTEDTLLAYITSIGSKPDTGKLQAEFRQEWQVTPPPSEVLINPPTRPLEPRNGACGSRIRGGRACELSPSQLTFLQKLPKAELHAHLNGSIPFPVLQQLATDFQSTSPGDPGLPDHVRAGIQRLQDGVVLNEIHDFFGLFPAVYALTSTPSALRRATHAVLEHFLEPQRDNGGYPQAAYLELRSTPRETPAMSRMQYIETVLEEVERYPSERAALIVSLDRRMDSRTAAECVECAVKLRQAGRRVVGIDLCGDPKVNIAGFDTNGPCAAHEGYNPTGG